MRIRIEKRIPIAAGMAGGSADAGAALRLVARAAGIEDDALLREIGAGLGADVAAQVRPRRYLATGAGERLTPLPPPAPYGVLVIPSRHELSTADVYREFDRLAPAARRDRPRRQAARGLHRGRRPARRADRQRPRARRAGAVPGDRRGARHGARGRRPPCARVRIGTDGDRPLRATCAARAPPPRACPSASRARSPSRRGGRCCEAGLDRLRRRAGRASWSGAGGASSPRCWPAAPWSPWPRSSTASASCTSRTSSNC